MNYLLTQEELDSLAGNRKTMREEMRKEFQEQLDRQISKFRAEMVMQLKKYGPHIEGVQRYPSADAQRVLDAVMRAMENCNMPTDEAEKEGA